MPIWIHRHYSLGVLRRTVNEAGRLLLLLAEVQGQRVILARVSTSNINDPLFPGQLENKLQDKGEYSILLGDAVNRIMDNIVDHNTLSSLLPRSASVMKNTREALRLADVWQLFNHSSWDFTFYSSPHLLSWIDYLFISKSAAPSVDSSSIGNIFPSDHTPESLHVVRPSSLAKSSRWRLNSSLQSNPDLYYHLRKKLLLKQNGHLLPLLV